jgi:hypothetical protein
VLTTKVSGKINIDMEKECKYGKMVQFMKDIGQIIRLMVLEG